MKEIWKDIVEYKGLYQISNLGRVKSLPRLHKCYADRNYTTKEKIIKGALNSKGYLRVSLKKDGNEKRVFIHRLVAQAFIPNPDNKKEVNHIDRNPLNCKVDNLEWVTHKENMEWASKCGVYDKYKDLHSFYGKKNIHIAIESVKRKVCMLDDNDNIIKVYNTMTDAWKENSLDSGGLTRCCQGKQKTCGGYKWRYIDE